MLDRGRTQKVRCDQRPMPTAPTCRFAVLNVRGAATAAKANRTALLPPRPINGRRPSAIPDPIAGGADPVLVIVGLRGVPNIRTIVFVVRHAVAIAVGTRGDVLARISYIGAVVDCIENAVAVAVGTCRRILIGVGYIRAVVDSIEDAVFIAVAAGGDVLTRIGNFGAIVD